MAKSAAKKKFDSTGHDVIEIVGAREHNLKNISVSFPRNKLVVITGISGSGKSSLAFDTIYAEGQRRYMESFSAYARSFMGNLERPDVDKINGLSPVISIEQKTTSRNPRSTVGTVTEIYDFMRLLFARAGEAFSYINGEKMVRQSEDQILDSLLTHFKNKKLVLLAPIVKGRKGHYRELFQQIRKSGYTKVRVDGDVQEITAKMQVDRYKIHDIEIVVDRIVGDDKDRARIGCAVAGGCYCVSARAGVGDGRSRGATDKRTIAPIRMAAPSVSGPVGGRRPQPQARMKAAVTPASRLDARSSGTQ